MLAKGAIITVQLVQGQYISTLFQVEKKGDGSRPVINLKRLNHLVKYESFQNGRFGDTQKFSPGGRVSVQARLQDAYFTIPLHQRDRKYLRFQWRGKLYEFQVLPFGLSSAQRVFTRVMKAPIAFLKKAYFQKRGVPRRFLSHQFKGNGLIKDAGHSMFFVHDGLHYKLEEIVSSPHSERGVSRVCDRYDPTDDLSPIRKGSQDHSSVCGSIGEVLPSQDVSVSHREVAKCINSNFAGTTALQVHANVEYQGSGSKPSELCGISGSDGPSSQRAEMVGEKSQVLERQIFYQSRPTVGCGHSNGCQPFRLGGRMSGTTAHGQWS